MSSPRIPFSLGVFSDRDEERFLGVVVDDQVTPVGDLDPLLAGSSLIDLLKDWTASFDFLAGAVARRRAGQGAPMSGLSVHAPLPDARQIFCTGANYRRHVVEMVVALGAGPATADMTPDQREDYGRAYVARQQAESDPYIFSKPVTAIAGPFDDLVLPAFSERMDWELELGAVIGREAYLVDPKDALACVAGYMVVNDLTARDKVMRTDPGAIGPDWLSAKGGPGLLPCGPLFVPAAFVPNPHDLAMKLSVNGQLMQDDRTSDMTFDIGRQVAFITRAVRMLPGDIVCTGSPAGNGISRGIFLKAGDVMEGEIEGLGRQVVRCVAA